MARQFSSFRDFYPYYLAEHSDLTCRRLHFAGTSLVVAILAITFFTQDIRWIILAPFAGYGFAWVGHFFFEKNKPATFTHPFYSFIGDWVMWKDMLTGKLEV